MDEGNKSTKSEAKEMILAYEAALSPLTMPVVLAFIGWLICKGIHAPVWWGIICGAAIGLFFGVKNLLKFLKNKHLLDSDYDADGDGILQKHEEKKS